MVPYTVLNNIGARKAIMMAEMRMNKNGLIVSPQKKYSIKAKINQRGITMHTRNAIF